MHIARCCCPPGSLGSLQNVVQWNELITMYVNNHLFDKAMACFEQMKAEGEFSPDSITFTCALKACALSGSLVKGCEIHVEVAENGLLKENVFVGNMLIGMYVKCGCLDKGKEVFDTITQRNVVSWTALLVGYTHHNKEKEALYCFEEMQIEGAFPNRVTFVCSLTSCANIRAIKEGCEIYSMIIIKGLELEENIGSSLVGMYAKCGMMDEAYHVFVKLRVQNVVGWAALIDGYVRCDRGYEALICFKKMQFSGAYPNFLIFTCTLKACGDIGALCKGMEIHSEVVRKELDLEENAFIRTSLIYMYMKCGSLIKAQEVFDMVSVRDIATWNALIGGYGQFNCHDEVLRFFEQLHVEGVFVDSIMLACVVKSCDATKGITIHAVVVTLGLTVDISLGNALVNMYGRYGMLCKCQGVFNMIRVRTVLTWNLLIEAYVCHGYSENALKCYWLMKMDNILPDSVTFIYILKSCTDCQDIEKGNATFIEISQSGLLKADICVSNAVVDMFSKCGALMKAREVFDTLPHRDEITWNVLIAGLVQYDCAHEALDCFEQMQLEGLSPDSATLTCMLKACGSIGCSERGELLHAMVARLGLLQRDPICGSALIDMYAKCGFLLKAQEVFSLVQVRNIVTWNALVSGYSQLGKLESVLFAADRMLEETNRVDALTFLAVLSACSHEGLPYDGFKYLRMMHIDYNIVPTPSHCTSVIDLLGRAGQLGLMMEMMEKAPFHPNVIMWLAVLGACRKWGDVELGKHAFEQVMFLHENDVAAHVCFYNILAGFDMVEASNVLA